jgi:general secretion pathway protein C
LNIERFSIGMTLASQLLCYRRSSKAVMAFERFIKKNFWAVILLLLGFVAFFTARSFSQLLGLSLSADDKQLSAPPLQARAAQTTQGARSTSAEAILSRNPFDHTTGPLKDAPKVEEVEAQEPDYSDPRTAPLCDGIKIIAVAALDNPDLSFAAMTVPGETKPVLRRRMQEVGGKKVEHIGRDRVWFSTGKSLCQAELFKEGKAAAPVAAAPPPVVEKSGGAPGVSPDIMKGISKRSATEWDVDRGTVDKIIENQAELMKIARIVPEKEGDKVVGIRMFGLKPDTLLGVLGMENGDRLETINGFEVANPEKALEAYARLRTAPKIVVQVNRRGTPINLDYNIK